MNRKRSERSKGKNIICSRCCEEKYHEAFGMCSVCLRRTKRETRPKFYLGTVYSTIKARVTHKDKLRPKYFGLDVCTRDEFINRFINDEQFLKLYKEWQVSGFKRIKCPSIDRIDNEKGYTLNNIEFIKHGINSGKDAEIPVKLYKHGKHIKDFKSIKDCALYLGKLYATVWCWVGYKRTSVDGYTLEEIL